MVLQEIKSKLEELGAELEEGESELFYYTLIGHPHKLYALEKNNGLKIIVEEIYISGDLPKDLSIIPITNDKNILPRRKTYWMTLNGFIYNHLRRRTYGVADSIAEELGIPLPEEELSPEDALELEKLISGRK